MQNIAQAVPIHPSSQWTFTNMESLTLPKTPSLVNVWIEGEEIRSANNADGKLNSKKTSSISGSVNGGSKSPIAVSVLDTLM